MTRAGAAAILVLTVAACGRDNPKPSTIANAGPAESRGVEAVDELSLAALLESDTWERMIDTRTGVVELRGVASAREEVQDEFWLRRQCNAHAVKAAHDRAALVHRRLIQNAVDYPLSCRRQDDDQVTCDQRGLGEYDLAVSFQFAPRDGRYYLIGVSTIDVGSNPETLEAQYDAELRKPDGC